MDGAAKHRQYRQQRRGTVYFTDSTVWAALKPWDCLKIDGVNYLFESAQDASALGQVYRVTVLEDISGKTIGV